MVTWKKMYYLLGKSSPTKYRSSWLWKQGNGGLWQYGTSDLKSQSTRVKSSSPGIQASQAKPKGHWQMGTPSPRCLVLGPHSELGWLGWHFSCPPNTTTCLVSSAFVSFIYITTYVHMCVPVYALCPDVCRGQKMMSDSLELDLHVFVGTVCEFFRSVGGTKVLCSQISTRGTNMFNVQGCFQRERCIICFPPRSPGAGVINILWLLYYLCGRDHTGSFNRPLWLVCQSIESIFMENVKCTLQFQRSYTLSFIVHMRLSYLS